MSALDEALGLVGPTVPLPRLPKCVDYSAAAVAERKASRQFEAAALDDPFQHWPDGRIDGLLDSEPPAVERFAGPLLSGRAHMVAGLGGVSKTRLLYSLGSGAVLGRLPWSWEVIRTGSAALFLTEDTLADAHAALHALGGKLSAEERRKLEHRLRVYPLAGHPMRLLALAGNALHETDAYDWVMRQIDRLPQPVAFLGFDPALGLTEGNELDQAHQRRLGELVDRIAIESGACAVLTAHAAKGLQQAEEIGSHVARGAGALTDAVRGELVLRTMTADEARRFGIDDRVERQRHVQLQLTKGNHAPPEAFAPIWLKRGPAGLLSEVTLAQVERGSVGEREMHALEILQEAHKTGESSLRFWRKQCEAAGLLPANAAESTREKAMERIRNSLVDAGLVAKGSARGLWIPT